MGTLSSLSRRASGYHLAALAVVVGTAFGPSTPAVFANGPKVGFDLGYMVECRDVTPPAFAMVHPDEKIMEADLRVSVRVEKGEEKDVEQLEFEITSPAERLRIVDFLPRTLIEADVADHIEVVKTTETLRSVGATVGTTISIGAGNEHANGAVVTSALPAANANATHRNELKETTKKIPPGRAVVTSGTLENEHGVFFKLRRSAAGTFEGIKPLSFRFVVPAKWHGDWMVISCTATGNVKRYFFKSTEEIGTAKAFLALYLAGDARAERAALEMAEAQERYFAVKPAKDRYDLIITTLATEARPWRSSSQTHTVAGSVRTPVTCLKPPTSGAVFKFAAEEKPAAGKACNWLKQTLDRVARFSAAPDWRGDEATVSE
ncbi:MAG TPA: hypothetical protein VG826_03855 [Pirellulales bacterium]|nr:hypothetical protein [Pirellulales bacterium]